MNFIPITVFIGERKWHYALFMHTAILGCLIRMEAHSIISDLTNELWRNIRKKGSQEETKINIYIHLGNIYLLYRFGIRFTNDENFEKELIEKLTVLEKKIIHDMTRYTLIHPLFRQISQR